MLRTHHSKAFLAHTEEWRDSMLRVKADAESRGDSRKALAMSAYADCIQMFVEDLNRELEHIEYEAHHLDEWVSDEPRYDAEPTSRSEREGREMAMVREAGR